MMLRRQRQDAALRGLVIAGAHSIGGVTRGLFLSITEQSNKAMKTDFLDTAFLELKSRLSEKRFVDLIVRKCGKKGICLSARERSALKKWFASGASGEPPLLQKNRRPKNEITISITSRDARRLRGRLAREIDEGVSAVVLATVERSARPALNAMRRSWLQASDRYDRWIRAFERRLARTWKTPLDQVAVQLLLARDLGAELNDELRRTPRKEVEFVDALTRLHARACQIASEVLVLLRAGYAEGALMRWRSLHEVSVVLQFIRARGPATAKRYLEHEVVESWKAVQEYSAHSARLGYEPVTVAELAQIKQAFDTAIQKHGPTFRTSYGWAATDLNLPKPSFADIEKAVGYAHFRPFYRMASHSTHANPKGILFQIGMMDGATTLPVGPTNYGLADAAQNTALTLSQSTAALITLAPNFDRLLLMKIMSELAGDIGNTAVAVQRRIEAREVKLREARGKPES